MVYSDAVQDFVNKNRPEEKDFSVPEIVEGLEKTEEDGSVVFSSLGLRDGYHKTFFDSKKGIRIKWTARLDIKNPTKVLYEPSVIRTGGQESFYKAKNIPFPEEFLLSHFKVQSIEIELTEIVVKIPLPQWAKEEPDGQGDWPNTSITSEICFASEALSMIFEFEKKLEDVKNDLKSQHCKKCGGVVKVEEYEDPAGTSMLFEDFKCPCGNVNESANAFYQKTVFAGLRKKGKIY